MAGLSEYREGFSMAPHRSTEHIVSPGEIQLLKPLEGFLCVAGHDRTAIRIPARHLDPKQSAFVPRIQAELSIPTAKGPGVKPSGRRWRQ
jgi:hypothetical protein